MRQAATESVRARPRAVELLLLVLIAAQAGFAASWIALRETPWIGECQLQDFVWTQSTGDTRTVTPERFFALPQQFADHDLHCTVELAADTELDIVVRRVEPRPRPGGQLDAFHVRFAALRLSTIATGEPYRSREQLLFDTQRGGARATPGVPVTVLVQARGQRFRANVAGRWLPWFDVADGHGSLALVSHGGTSVLRHWKVTVHGDGAAPPFDWLAAGIAALVLGIAAALRRGALVVPGSVAIVLVVLGAALSHSVVFRHRSGMSMPDVTAVLVGALCALPLAAIVLAARVRPALWCLGLVMVPLALEFAARIEWPRLEPLADPRLDLHFGIASGGTPFESFAQRLRSSLAIHTLGDPEPRVLLLGGASIFEASGPDRGRHVAVAVAGALPAAAGRRVEIVVAGTTFAHALQQSLLYQRFHARLRPKVVVLAVGGAEAMAVERVPPREVAAAGAEAALVGPSLLWELFERSRDGRLPPSTPLELRATVAELAAFVHGQGAKFVVATAADVDPTHRAVLSAWCRETATPFVEAIVDGDGEPHVETLVAEIGKSLRDG